MSNWALVTGASDRIGKSIALKLAELGYDIIIHYNSSKKKAFDLQKQIQKLGVRCINIKCDFVKIKNIIKFCNEISQFQIKILINNASVFFEIDGKSEFNRTLDIFNINFFAPFLLIKKISETNSMFKVINILDTKISKNSIDFFEYALTKKCLELFTKTAALKYAPNITINAIAPGLILPPRDRDLEYIEKKALSIPLKKHGSIIDINDAIDYLIKSDFITGQVLFVDGGENL